MATKNQFNALENLPNNPDAESSLLGSILLTSKVNDEATLLRKEDFYQERNQIIWENICKFRAEKPNLALDLVSFTQFLREQGKLEACGGVGYISSLTDTASASSNASYYAQIIKDNSQRRNLITKFYQKLKDAQDESKNPEDVYRRTIEELSLEVSSDRLPFKSYQVTEDTLFSFLDQFKKNKDLLPYSTGLSNLDKAIAGGFHDGELVLLGGQTGLGKTSFALQQACTFLEQGHDVLYFSLEMSGEELVAKILSYYMHKLSYSNYQYREDALNRYTLSYKWIQYNQDQTEDQKLIFGLALQEFQKIQKHLFISEGTGSISVEDIKNQVVQHYIKFGKVPVIIIDYLQILKPCFERATAKGNIDYDVTTLKALATGNTLEKLFGEPSSSLKTLVFGIQSYNRSSNGLSATETSGSGSASLEYSGDVVLSIEPSRLKEELDNASSNNKKQIGTDVFDNEKSKTIRDLTIKVLKCRFINPPKPDDMPKFKAYHSCYFVGEDAHRFVF